MVVRAVAPGHQAGVRQLVEGLLVEADGERLDGPVAEPAHQRDDHARVDAPAEQRTERHIGDQPQPDRLGQDLKQRLGRLSSSSSRSSFGVYSSRQ